MKDKYIKEIEFRIGKDVYSIKEPRLEQVFKYIGEKKTLFGRKKRTPQENIEGVRKYIRKHSKPTLDILEVKAKVAKTIIESLFYSFDMPNKVQESGQKKERKKKNGRKTPSYLG